MAHDTNWENEGIYWDIYGNLDSEEVIKFSEELSRDSRMEKIKYFIWNSINVTEILIDKDDATLASVFSKFIHEYNSNIKDTFVAKDSNLKLLIQEYIDSSTELGSTWEFKLFENVEDARSWVTS